MPDYCFSLIIEDITVRICAQYTHNAHEAVRYRGNLQWTVSTCVRPHSRNSTARVKMYLPGIEIGSISPINSILDTTHTKGSLRLFAIIATQRSARLKYLFQSIFICRIFRT